MENIFIKLISLLKFKERPVLGPLIVFALLIIIVLLVSLGNKILPFIYTAF